VNYHPVKPATRLRWRRRWRRVTRVRWRLPLLVGGTAAVGGWWAAQPQVSVAGALVAGLGYGLLLAAALNMPR